MSRPERSGARQGCLDTADPRPYSASLSAEERLVAGYSGAGLATGPHPMAYHRAELRAEGIVSVSDLMRLANNTQVCIAGCVIARQRPGTAKGFVFLSLEDETGIASTILTPACRRCCKINAGFSP